MFKQSVKSESEFVNLVKDLRNDDISSDIVSAVLLESTDSKVLQEVYNEIDEFADYSMNLSIFSLLITFNDHEENKRLSTDLKYHLAEILKKYEKSTSLITITTKFSKQTKDN